jgi:hypothetical protein
MQFSRKLEVIPNTGTHALEAAYKRFSGDYSSTLFMTVRREMARSRCEAGRLAEGLS